MSTINFVFYVRPSKNILLQTTFVIYLCTKTKLSLTVKSGVPTMRYDNPNYIIFVYLIYIYFFFLHYKQTIQSAMVLV